jgi:hypothetical protein
MVFRKSIDHTKVVEISSSPRIGWGVDGYGYRHFICDLCNENLGKSKTLSHLDIKHKCGCNDGKPGQILLIEEN